MRRLLLILAFFASIADAALSVIATSAWGGVAVDGQGNVFFGDCANSPGSVKVYNSTSNVIYTVAGLANLKQPKGLAATASGSLLYIAEASPTGPGRLLLWNRSTGSTSVLVTGSLPNPVCTKFDPSGDVWVAEATTNSIIRFSGTRFNTTVDSIPGIGEPRDFQPDCNGNLWIADYTANAIKYWDPISRSVRTMFTGFQFRQPKGLVLDPGNANLYIVNALNSIVVQVSLQTCVVSTIVSTGLSGPFALAMDVRNGDLYMSDQASSRIMRSSPTTAVLTPCSFSYPALSPPCSSYLLTVVSAALAGPVGIAAAWSTPNVYFCDMSNNALKVWNSATNSLTSVISGLNAPKGVAVNVQGTLVYIGDSGNQRILVWNVTSSRIVTRLGGTSNYPSTVGMKLDAAGNLWVADITRNAVVVWNASTNVSSVAVAGLNGPRDLQPDCFGSLWISDSGNNSIKFWNSQSRQTTTVFSGPIFNNPRGILIDPGNSNLFVVNSNANTVLVISLVQCSVSTFISSGLSGPFGITLDSSGVFYISDQASNTIKRYVSPGAAVMTPCVNARAVPACLSASQTLSPTQSLSSSQTMTMTSSLTPTVTVTMTSTCSQTQSGSLTSTLSSTTSMTVTTTSSQTASSTGSQGPSQTQSATRTPSTTATMTQLSTTSATQTQSQLFTASSSATNNMGSTTGTQVFTVSSSPTMTQTISASITAATTQASAASSSATSNLGSTTGTQVFTVSSSPTTSQAIFASITPSSAQVSTASASPTMNLSSAATSITTTTSSSSPSMVPTLSQMSLVSISQTVSPSVESATPLQTSSQAQSGQSTHTFTGTRESTESATCSNSEGIRATSQAETLTQSRTSTKSQTINDSTAPTLLSSSSSSSVAPTFSQLQAISSTRFPVGSETDASVGSATVLPSPSVSFVRSGTSSANTSEGAGSYLDSQAGSANGSEMPPAVNAAIVGGVVGGIVFAIIVLVILAIRCRQIAFKNRNAPICAHVGQEDQPVFSAVNVMYRHDTRESRPIEPAVLIPIGEHGSAFEVNNPLNRRIAGDALNSPVITSAT